MPRREQLEAMLRESPDDAFLRYGLALECAREGEVAEAVARLRALIADQPDYVAAYFQAGQLLGQTDDFAEAREMLRQGIQTAQRIGDRHAAEEMQGLLLQWSSE